MKITIFTSHQPRHRALVKGLAGIASDVCVVTETQTGSPGAAADLPRRSPLMQAYFSRVAAAEKVVFGDGDALPANVRLLTLKTGALASIDIGVLEPCLNSDHYVVFGSSYIKGPLVEFLISMKAYNIHMGTSPFYRGSACNFWACYDKKYDYVGATIHLLSKGLDSGDILFHAFPPAEGDPFVLGMLAVQSAHQGFIEHLAGGDLERFRPVRQDKSAEIRYTRIADFNEDVARSYMADEPSRELVLSQLRTTDRSRFIRPYRMTDPAPIAMDKQ
jgi:hypothetical protein